MPERIQLRRTKGWKMPPNTVRVARPSRFGNPFRVGLKLKPCGCRSAGECTHNAFRCETPAEAVEAYRNWLNTIMACGNGRMRKDIESLRGKNLACWCPIGSPCHADVLLELANNPEKGTQ